MAATAIRTLEEKALNAWPCIQQAVYDGWMLRFSHGYTRRANSVIPLYRGWIAVDRKIRRCEESYLQRNLKPVFKMLPFVQPGNLDLVLQGAGYRKEAETCVQVCDLKRLDLPAEQTLQMWEEPTDSWLDVYARLNGISQEERPFLRSILSNIVPRKCFAILLCDGRPVSCGIGIREENYVGLFGLVTEKQHRNRGFGRQLIGQIARWGESAGADKVYLQVVADNRAARHLYAKLGFEEAYRYWYRVKES